MMINVRKRATRIGKRVLAQTAMSATVMTALHFASVSEFPPATWIFGPGSAEKAVPAATIETTSLPATPAARVIALPTAMGPALQSASDAMAGNGAPRQTPAAAVYGQLATLTNDRTTLCAEGCFAQIPRTVAHPTPRPTLPRSAAGSLPVDPTPPLWTASSVEAPELIAPELSAADRVPFPPDEASFVLADLIPDRHAVMEGVFFIGDQARTVVSDAASGALDLVRH